MALTLATVLLTLAVVAGTILALWHMRAVEPEQHPPRIAGLAHGIIGAVGFAALLFALAGPPRAVAAGAGNFGTIAAGVFSLVLLTGLAVLLLRRAAALTITIHAGLAICAYVIYLAWVSL